MIYGIFEHIKDIFEFLKAGYTYTLLRNYKFDKFHS